MEVKILERSLIINYIEYSIHDWQMDRFYYSHDPIDYELPSGLIMSHKTFFEAMIIKSRDYLLTYISITPEGKTKIYGIPIFKTNDIDDNTLIFF